MSSTLKVFTVILIVLLYGAMRCDSCSSSEPEGPPDLTNQDIIDAIYATSSEMKGYYIDLYYKMQYEADDVKGSIIGSINAMYEKLVDKITANRKQLENVIVISEKHHQRTLQELAGIKTQIQSIIDVVVIDKEQNIITEKQVDEFISELKLYTQHGENIEGTYKKFLNLFKNPSGSNKRSIYQFIDYCYGYYDYEMGQILNAMNNRLTGERGVFYLMTQPLVETYVLATRHVSTLEYLSNLANYMAALETRCFLMASNAKGLISYLNPDDSYEFEFMSYRTTMMRRLMNLVRSSQSFAQKYTGRYFIFDSHSNKIGNRYVNFYNVFKGMYFRDSYCENVGKNSVVKGSKDSHNHCNKINEGECKGTLQCSARAENTDVQICFSKEDEERRYEFVVFTNEETRKCIGRKKYYTKDSRCVNCECYCNHTYADRFISLDEMVTDIANNRLLTGVRFTKINGAIGLDIEESELNIQGHMVSGTSNWIINKAMVKFEISHQKRELHLTEIKTDNRRAISGLRFREVEDGVELQLRVNDLIVCDKNRTMLSTTYKWIKADKKEEVLVDFAKGVGHPSIAEQTGPVSIFSYLHTRVRISPTSFEEDGAQSVVPFFDTRQVSPTRPLVMRGIGLVYKRRIDTYGGFVAPYVIIADYSDRVDVDFLNVETRSDYRTISMGTNISIELIRASIAVNFLILLLLC